MGWINEGETVVEVLDERPSLKALHTAFLNSFENDGLIPERVLALCRLRIAFIHDVPLMPAGALERLATEPSEEDAHGLTEAQVESLAAGVFTDFDDSERVALAIAEKMPYAHHEVSDDEVAAARDAFDNGGAVSLLTALAFFDATCRMKVALGAAAAAQLAAAQGPAPEES